MGRFKSLGSLNSFLSYAPQLSGANSVSLFTLLLAFPQLLSNHPGGWQHPLDRRLGSPHSHLEARIRGWLWHFLFIDMAGDIFISLLFHDYSCESKRHLLLGRKAMTNLDSLLKSRDITLPTKVHLVKAMVFPVVMYGCESWTIKKAECWRIEAFEL